MRPRLLTLDGATAAELVVSLGALADPDWAAVFTAAPADAALCPARLLTATRRLGRYAFYSLLEPCVGRDVDGLLAWVEAQDPRDLHHRLLGGHRRQLRAHADEAVLDEALAGQAARLHEALAQTILVVTPWLLATPSETVQRTLLDALRRWQALRLPRAVEEQLQSDLAGAVARLRAAPDPLDLAAPGLRYDPPGARRELVLAAAPSVHPIVAVVDDVTRHVVVCSPPAEGSPRERLVGLAKALGDDVRVQLLLLVRAAPRTTTELSRELEVPRTSLLHHLAILRAAGLLATSVQGARTVYRWRPEALKDLADAAHATLGMGVEISRHLE